MLNLSFNPFYQDPFQEMRRMQVEINRLFEGGRALPGAEFPALNLWTSDEGAQLTAELPGINPADLDLSVVGQSVVLRGRRNLEAPEGVTWHRQERPAGEFLRTLELPFKVDATHVEARFNQGLLTVTLPRAEEEKPRKIAVCA